MRFYVYEHWRPDKDVCFYVGKGKGRRAYIHDARQRNKRYTRIVTKLARLGMCVEVRMVAEALDEDNAFRIERERIAFWRARGGELANVTDGGDGVSGLKHSPESIALMSARKRGKVHSAETRAKMSRAASGKTKSEAMRRNLSIAKTGKPQKPHSHEHNAKIGAALQGRKDSIEVREKKRLGALKKAPPSVSVREQISETVKSLWNDPAYRAHMEAAHRGYVPTEDARANMRKAQQARGPRSVETREKQRVAMIAAHARRKAQREGVP